MATPAAVLSILVKTQGAQAAAAQLGGIDKSGRAAAGGLSKAEGQAKRSSKTFSAMGTAAKSAGVLIGAAGLAKGISSAVTEYREAQKVGSQTTAVLKSTGSAANVTAKHIQNLAGSISKKSGIDDEAIQSSENMLLTFTKLRNETGKGNKIFDQATQTVTDMSVALGQSGKSSAIQLGKALNDPVKGITALRRVGVSFTADQQKQITTLEKTGHHLDAQKIILKELRTEFAGSAAAQATAGDKFKVSLGNLAEAAGAVLVPAMDKVLPVLTKFFDQMVTGTGVGGALISKFKDFGTALAPLGQSIATIVSWLIKHEGVTKALAIGIGVLTAAIVLLNLAVSANPFVLAAVAIAALVVGVVTAYREFSTFRKIVDTVVNAVKSAIPTIVAVAKGAMSAFLAVFRAVWPVIKGYFQGGFIAVKAIITGAAQILSGAVQVIKGILHGDFREIWDGIKTIFRGAFTSIKGIITGAAHALGAAAGAVGDAIKGAFSGALGKAAGVVVGFVNGIIDVINKIPGVNIGHVGVPQSLQQASGPVGNTAQGQTHGLARGGAFGLTGGVVNAPMVMMGEEAPTHPEFVIPTNPAYRKRAQGLLAQAAGTIGGMAKGGILGAIGGAIAGGAKGLLGKLPGVGDLPSWMKGLGGFLLGKVGSFIKDKVTDILPGGGGAPGKAGGPAGTTVFKGITMAKWVAEALKYAQSKGVESQPTSGYRPGAITINGTPSEHRGLQYPHGAVDFGSFTTGLGPKMAVVNATRDFKWPLLAPIGFSDDGHASGTGHRKGGIIKAFRKGGILGLAEGGSSPPFFIPGMGEAMPRVMSEKAKAARERARKARLKAMREKQHPRWQGHWEQQVNRQGGVIKAFAQGGINTAIAAARKAGFSGEALVRMVAIAGRESNYNPRAKNLVPPDHSIGLWQINQLAHHGRFGSDAELMNPDTNARAAWILSGHGHNFSPWSTNRGLSQGLIDRARQAVAAFKGGGGTSAGGGSNAGSGAGSTAQKVNPLDQKIANADLAIEQAKRGTIKIGGVGGRKISSSLQQTQALLGKRKLVGARIRSIRKALKGKVSPAKRLALTQELTQRLQEHAQLGTDIQALRTPAAAGGDGGSIGDVGGAAGGDGSDPNQPLNDALNAAAQAAQDLAQAMRDHQASVDALATEEKRRTDFAATATNTSNYQAWKALADIMSGQIVGYGATARAFTPGTGVEVAY